MFHKLRKFFGIKEEVKAAPKDSFVGDEPTADLWHQVDRVINEANQLHADTMDALGKESKVAKKTQKYKVEYYSSTPDLNRHYNDRVHYYKVAYRTENNLSRVNVCYLNEGLNSNKAASVSGDGDLNLTVKLGNKNEFIIPVHEAHDLALALMKYHELGGAGVFAKVKKSTVEKKNGKS